MASLMRSEVTDTIIFVLKEFDEFYQRPHNKTFFSYFLGNGLWRYDAENHRIVNNKPLMKSILLKLNDEALMQMYRHCGELANKYPLISRIAKSLEGYETAIMLPYDEVSFEANYLADNTPAWRKDVVDAIEGIKKVVREWGPNWQEPVFVIGISPNATCPGMSVGSTSGMYFVPKSREDPLFYTSLMNYIITPTIALVCLQLMSSDYGFFTDVISSGIGGGYSVSFGGTIGVFKSMNDFVGPFNETGGSGGPGILSVGGDIVFNKVDYPVGLSVTIGVSVPKLPVNGEGHIRFGNTFVYSQKQRKWLSKD
jgi:hypothetical protein